MIRNFIIVDDDAFNNIMCKMLLKKTLGDISVKTFESPEEGLAFIHDEYGLSSDPAVLLLDINMPTITGWQFMKAYESFDETVKANIAIYIVSSSVDNGDKEAAASFKSVKGFISKPLEKSTIQILSQSKN